MVAGELRVKGEPFPALSSPLPPEPLSSTSEPFAWAPFQQTSSTPPPPSSCLGLPSPQIRGCKSSQAFAINVKVNIKSWRATTPKQLEKKKYERAKNIWNSPSSKEFSLWPYVWCENIRNTPSSKDFFSCHTLGVADNTHQIWVLSGEPDKPRVSGFLPARAVQRAWN